MTWADLPRVARLTVASMVGFVALAGCAHASRGVTVVSISTPTDALPAPATSTVPLPPDSPAGILREVTLTYLELPPGDSSSEISQGDQVTGQVTLDYCGGYYPSEMIRIARYQTEIVDKAGHSIASQESVYYPVEGAAEALQELRSELASCDPKQYVPSDVAGNPSVRTEATTLAASGLVGLMPDHVAFTARLTDQAGKTETEVDIFQRRGQVMVAVYGTTVPLAEHLAKLAAVELAALTPDQAGQS